MLEEGDDGQILVNQNNLSALVSAIRSAGYEVNFKFIHHYQF